MTTENKVYDELLNSILGNFNLETFKDTVNKINEKAGFLAHKDDNNNTALHLAFAMGDNELITYLLDLVGDTVNILNAQNINGNTPLDMIMESESPADLLESIKDVASLQKLLLAKGYEGNTFLHTLAVPQTDDNETKFQATYNKIFKIAKNFIVGTLIQENEFGSSAIYEAVMNKNIDFLKAALPEDLSSDNLKLVLKAGDANTIMHAAFLEGNTEIINFIISKIGSDSTLLTTSNMNGNTPISSLFENGSFTTIFANITNKELVIDSIITNSLNNTALLSITEADDKKATKEKITAIYAAIKDDGNLLSRLLTTVDDQDDAILSEFFNDDIIRDKLLAVEKKIVSTVKNLHSNNITVDALKNNALDKIQTLSETFPNKLPENFGNAAKNEVKATLNTVVEAQKATITGDDKDALEKAYTAAKEAIKTYTDVYTALEDDQVTKVNAIKSLSEVIFKKGEAGNKDTGKALEIVGKVCLDSYNQVDEAKTCESLIKSFASPDVLQDVIWTDFAKTQLDAATNFIKENSFKSDDLVKIAAFAYSLQYINSIDEYMKFFVEQQNDYKKSHVDFLKKKVFAEISTNIKGDECVFLPGFGKTSAVKSSKCFETNFVQVYKGLAGAKNLKDYTTSHSAYKDNFTNDYSKANQLKDSVSKEMCESAKLNTNCTLESAVKVLNNQQFSSDNDDNLIKCVKSENFATMTYVDFFETCLAIEKTDYEVGALENN